MRVLLDENVPLRLAHELKGFDCGHVVALGWAGIKNGALLRQAEEDGFSCLITLDRQMSFQQNVSGRTIGIVVLRPARQGKAAVLELAPKILQVLPFVEPGQVHIVGSD